MDNKTKKPRVNRLAWLILLIIGASTAAFLSGMIFNKEDKKTSTQNTPASLRESKKTTIDSLVSYQLPADWSRAACTNGTEVVLIVPAGKVSPDCKALSENWPMKISIDAMKTTDCNQIKVNNQHVTNHTCLSKFINGHKVLVSNTTYNDKSQYSRNTAVSDYYIQPSGKVVKLEYANDLTLTEDDYQTQFDQIASSIKVK